MSNILSKLTAPQKIKLGIVTGLLGLLGLGIFYATTVEQPIGEDFKAAYQYGGDFVLKGPSGEVALKDYRGKVVILYFGFLNCTEACPISMGTIVGALNKLNKTERENVQIFFISVDPERDDMSALKEFSDHYAEYFSTDKNPTIIQGITSSKEHIKKVSEQYGVFFDLVDLEESGLGYTVDHSSRFYMVRPDGKLLTTMSHSTTPVELAAKIKEMQINGVKPTKL